MPKSPSFVDPATDHWVNETNISPNRHTPPADPKAQATQQSIRQTVLRWLTRRDYAEQEITRKLLQKGYVMADIQMALADYIQNGLINDQRFADQYVEIRQRKGYGPRHLAASLKARGINSTMIQQSLKLLDQDWFDAIYKTWYKRFKGKQPTDKQSRAKQIRFLLSRGFTHEQITNLFDQLN